MNDALDRYLEQRRLELLASCDMTHATFLIDEITRAFSAGFTIGASQAPQKTYDFEKLTSEPYLAD